jgi:hypothetical protein
VRTQASRTEGDLIDDLPSRSGVERIAQRDEFFLILFDDPREHHGQKMGWLPREAFLPDPSAKREPIRCPRGQIALLRFESEVCAIPCTQDSQCPNAGTCTGKGVRSENGHAGDPTKFCQPK